MNDGPPTRRSKRTKGEKTRARLLSQAIEIFGLRGFNQARMCEIARAAGLSPTGAYLYFADKEELWACALRADLDALAEHVRGVGTDSAVGTLVAQLPNHPVVQRVLVDGAADDLAYVERHPALTDALGGGDESGIDIRGAREQVALGVLVLAARAPTRGHEFAAALRNILDRDVA